MINTVNGFPFSIPKDKRAKLNNTIYLIPKVWVKLGNIVEETKYNRRWLLKYSLGIIKITMPEDDQYDTYLDINTPAIILMPTTEDGLGGDYIKLKRWGGHSQHCYWKNIVLGDVIKDVKTINENHIVLEVNNLHYSSPDVTDVLTTILSDEALNTPYLKMYLATLMSKVNENSLEFKLHLPSEEDHRFLTTNGGWLSVASEDQMSRLASMLTEIDSSDLDRETLDEIAMTSAYIPAIKSARSVDLTNVRIALKDHLDDPNLKVFDDVGKYAKSVLWFGIEKHTGDVVVLSELHKLRGEGRYYYIEDGVEIIAALPIGVGGYNEFNLFTTDVDKLNKLINDKAEFLAVKSTEDFKDKLANGKYQIVIVDNQDIAIMSLDKGRAKDDLTKAFVDMYILKFIEACKDYDPYDFGDL